jgi:hypothetical protein
LTGMQRDGMNSFFILHHTLTSPRGQWGNPATNSMQDAVRADRRFTSCTWFRRWNYQTVFIKSRRAPTAMPNMCWSRGGQISKLGRVHRPLRSPTECFCTSPPQFVIASSRQIDGRWWDAGLTGYAGPRTGHERARGRWLFLDTKAVRGWGAGTRPSSQARPNSGGLGSGGFVAATTRR